jgi:hypothetical protein
MRLLALPLGGKHIARTKVRVASSGIKKRDTGLNAKKNVNTMCED